MKPLLLILSSFLILNASFSAPPNVVIIFIDDLGYADIGPFGATKQKTPNLDKMAKEGMKLTSFYAAPVCSVSRAQMMSGCYGARISVPGVYFPGHANGLNPAETTIAEHLKQQGYATQCVGKWHLGDQPEFLPTKQGFDHYFGIPYSNDMQKTAKETGAKVVPLLRDDKVAELLTDEAQSRIVERYTEEAVGFIRASKDQPFFLYFPHSAVHTPIWPGEKFRGKSQNGRFGDWVEEVDWSVGRVLDTLRELKLDENTLVIFTSDNGPWLIKGADGGSALPLRGGKGSTWEGGVRVPTIARWPGKIAPGSVCDAVAGTIDLLPTCVSIAGGKVPAEPVIDGRDLSPLLLGKTTESQREAHYYFAGYNLQAVRQGPWKLAIATQPETMGKGAANDASKNPRLYNLDTEIGEQTNLADQHPDIVAKLQTLADKMNAELGGKQPTARRSAGEVAHPQTLYPTSDAPRGKKKDTPEKAAGKPVSLEALKPGDVLKANAAPQVAQTGFTLSCTVETTQPDAILIAHGGLSAGYALHLRGGHLVFMVRTGGADAFDEIQSPSTISGSTRILATLAQDRTMTLTVNDQIIATGKARNFINRQPQEDFCVGHDNVKPVAAYTAKGKFEGSITILKITTP
ncbi:sulfatase-like hydrolase/transferase [Prosthecobacter sp.]|uniref:sulfatase-like hydrolase/transferase n=1 Tax=Prosthecobacter sp. TaxID=1965333 RepID=UPI002ABC786B|nr:sulfatase-like hydrolase/transferase [Prosthecobacter sp.]MDZ4402769.1 sulfatase-like hydrolase/transferase [Prosthecobacter sp.]